LCTHNVEQTDSEESEECHKTMKEAWERMKVADSAAKGAAKSRHVMKKL